MNLEFIQYYQQRVENCLKNILPPSAPDPQDLNQAMTYAVLAGGKRIRPILCYLTGEMLQVDIASLDDAACALELIHTYSLIHDDLPAMDDDELRRGMPTCHIAFNEATAILAGDALQSLAFEILSRGSETPSPTPQQRLNMVHLLAQSSGTTGMAGGQALDLSAEGREINLSALQTLHAKKTGALIRASILMPAQCVAITPQQLQALETFTHNIGLAFQIQDDILDEEGTSLEMGKPQGSDRKHNKSTYPALIGLKQAKVMAQELLHHALQALTPFGDAALPLKQLSQFITSRRT